MKTKLRKIYYVPGLISAIIIPLVFWYLGNAKLKEPIPNLMDFGLPSKYNSSIPIEKQNSFEGMRNWDYKKIIVKPNTAKANSKYYVSELKKLNARNEKETGIEFILNDDNSYGDFASILNDFHIAQHDRYGIDLDKTGHLFAVVDYKDPNIEKKYNYLSNDMNGIIKCGTGLMMEYENNPNNYKGYKKFKYQITQLPEKAFYLIFSFLIFLQISALSLVRKFI